MGLPGLALALGPQGRAVEHTLHLHQAAGGEVGSHLGRLAPGQAVMQPILVSLYHPALAVAAVTCDPDRFTVTITPRKTLSGSEFTPGRRFQDGAEFITLSRGVEVRLQAKADAPLGPFAGKLQISFTDPARPPRVIPFSGRLARAEGE